MDKQQKDVKEFHEAIGQPVNVTPTLSTEQDRILRARLILEEALELIYDMAVEVYVEPAEQRTYLTNLKYLEFDTSILREPNLTGMYKELVDLNYVVKGTGVVLGLDIDKGHQEVHRSNMTKVIDGHKDETGKWRKGPSYEPANMNKVLDDQKNAN